MVALDRLVDVLGSLGTHLACAPRGRDAELRGVALNDPAENTPAAAGDVLLGLGTPSVAAAVRLVSSTVASAVVLHGRPPLDERVIAAAKKSGAAVLLVDPSVPWSQLANVTQTLVNGGTRTGDLFGLADVIAGVVGGPVTIEDQQSRVLAYSYRQEDVDPVRVQTILGRRVPEEARRALDEFGVFTHLASSDEPIFVPKLTPQLGNRLVAAVRAGRELLGSVWVEVTGPVDAARSAALVDGARTAALHLLRSRASTDLERQAEADLVIRLLDQPESADVARLGLPSADLRVIAVQAHAGEGEHGAAVLAFQRATAGFGWSRPGRSALFGNVLYTVIPASDDAVAWVRSLVRELPAEATVLAGIGGPAEATQLPLSRQEADECLALSTGTPVVYDDAWAQVLLLRLAAVAEAGRLPTRGPISNILRHDAEFGTQYAATLRAWLAAQGDARAAAKALNVHPNTLRYRMQKMSEVTPLPLDDPDQRLAMAIALQITLQNSR